MTRSRLARLGLQLGLVAGGLTAGALAWGAAPALADTGASAAAAGISISVRLGPIAPAPVTVTTPPVTAAPVAPPPLPAGSPRVAPHLPARGTTTRTVPGLPEPASNAVAVVPQTLPTGFVAGPPAAAVSLGSSPFVLVGATSVFVSPAEPVAPDLAVDGRGQIGLRQGPAATAGFGIPKLIPPSDGTTHPPSPLRSNHGTTSSGPSAGSDHHELPSAMLQDAMSPDGRVGWLGRASQEPHRSATPGRADPRPG
ncbi:MAG: hypothetical protein JWL73_3081 [Actinomycetia bacterium]|nr:hypothetical protein [Actinomycetes bacterium]